MATTFRNIPGGGINDLVLSAPLVPVTASGWTYPDSNGAAALDINKTNKVLMVPIFGINIGDTINTFNLLGSGYVEDTGGSELQIGAVLKKMNVVTNVQSTIATLNTVTFPNGSFDFGINSTNTLTDVDAEVQADCTYRLEITATTTDIAFVSINGIGLNVTRT